MPDSIPPDQGVEAPRELATPIDSRFLFVDVASQRAKQLRRGALLRLQAGDPRSVTHKLERAAMEEVRQRLVDYSVPVVPTSK